jgi:hypothetical protein
MAATGLLGEYKGSQAREVTMTLDEYEAMKKNMIADEVAGYADLTEDSEEDDEAYEYEEVEEDADDEADEYEEASEYIDDDEYEKA